MSNGIVTQIIGAVIDVEFDKDNIPKVYEALMIDESGTTLLKFSNSWVMVLLEQSQWVLQRV